MSELAERENHNYFDYTTLIIFLAFFVVIIWSKTMIYFALIHNYLDYFWLLL
jgi:hypothetical protein